ncbi:MAG: hypothetical protein AAGU74_04815 [Bacillota bacterium]
MFTNKATVVGRSLKYVLRTALIVLGIIAAGYFVFQTGLNGSNMYILATEGMQLRAECVLQDSSKDALLEYFTPDFIADDALLSESTYANYTIADFNYTLEVENISVLPWSETAGMQVVERVERITGQINKNSIPEGTDPTQFLVPEWEAGRYRISFVKIDDRWYISGLELIDAAPEQAPKRTPRITSAPENSPSPTASSSPQASSAQ